MFQPGSTPMASFKVLTLESDDGSNCAGDHDSRLHHNAHNECDAGPSIIFGFDFFNRILFSKYSSFFYPRSFCQCQVHWLFSLLVSPLYVQFLAVIFQTRVPFFLVDHCVNHFQARSVTKTENRCSSRALCQTLISCLSDSHQMEIGWFLLVHL